MGAFLLRFVRGVEENAEVIQVTAVAFDCLRDLKVMPIDEDTLYFGHRSFRNVTATDLEPSSLGISFMVSGGNM